MTASFHASLYCAAAFVLMGTLSGCAEVVNPGEEEPTVQADSAFTIYWGIHSQVFPDSLRAVIRDSTEWRALLANQGVTDAPDTWTTDFSRQHVVVAAMGGRGTSGYLICVDSVRARPDGAVTYITRREQTGAQQGETHPAHVVRTSVRAEGMTFHETVVTDETCQPSMELEP